MRLWAWVACVLAVPCWAEIAPGEYKGRRDALRKARPDTVVVLFGGTEDEHGDLRNGFFQEPNFYYLTGWTQPGAALLVTPAEDVLLLPRKNPAAEKWTGPKASPADAGIQARTGFATVLPMESLEAQVLKAAEAAPKVATLLNLPQAAKLRALLPLRTVGDATGAIGALRRVKSETELGLMRRALDATLEAHRAAWRATEPGKREYEIAAVMGNAYFARGCERHAYAPIVGSGPNATTLHYSENRRRMDAGELLLMDVGAECAMYAADITRTVPVNGRFTSRQREIYDIVLGAQKAAMVAAKPGVLLNGAAEGTLQKVALDYINAHGKDRNGEPLGKYFTHGLGHPVGLDVHDPMLPEMPLKVGDVITIEPGLYIPDEGIGIRIEDMILITEGGSKLLSGDLPREAEEIEREMGRRKR